MKRLVLINEEAEELKELCKNGFSNAVTMYNENENYLIYWVKRNNFEANKIILKISIIEYNFIIEIDERGEGIITRKTESIKRLYKALKEYNDYFENSKKQDEDEAYIYKVLKNFSAFIPPVIEEPRYNGL